MMLAAIPELPSKLAARRFNWVSGFLRSGWKLEPAKTDTFKTWFHLTLMGLPRNVQDSNVESRFQKLFKSFPAWHHAIVQPDSLIELRVDPKCWDIPWEAGLAGGAYGDNLRHAGIVRTIAG